jgi:YVTN family beta-propeller protein
VNRPASGLAAAAAFLTFFLPAGASAARAEAPDPVRITREGLTVELSVRPAGGEGEVREGDYADVAFRISDAESGQPVRSLSPGAWMDLGNPLGGREGGAPFDCREKIGLYLSGRVGIRPMIDLNSYYVLALNRDSSISVVDPMVGMAGRTYLYAHIPLPYPGADWAKTADDSRLFVTMPRAGRVAVVDTESFKVVGNVDVGGTPVRIALQKDGRYLWIGDDSPGKDRGGVVVVDPAKAAVVARIPTGRGRHEIAFSGDDRYAFVANRDEGTVSVIEVGKLAKVRDVRTGPRPAALGYSERGRALYVADDSSGEIAVLDGTTHGVTARIAAAPGLGAIRFTADGRWGFVLNGRKNAVHVVDVAANRLVHTVPVGGRPYDIAITNAFAYVRSLDSAQVAMIPLSELGRAEPPAVTEFPAGTESPATAGTGPAVAGPMVPALEEAAVLVANPADGNVYFYMEGMVAPMATFRNYGHRPVALEVVNRSLVEREPGVYRTTVRLPAAGRYDVGFLLNSPSVVHCFAFDVGTNPALVRAGPALEIEHLLRERRVPAGEPLTVSFKLTDRHTGAPRSGLTDVRVLHYMIPGRHRAEAAAREVGEGVYEATLSVPETGAYYVHVAVPSEKVGFGDLTLLSLVAGTPAPGGRRGRP